MNTCTNIDGQLCTRLDQPSKIVPALLAARREMPDLTFDSEADVKFKSGGGFKNKFASLKQVRQVSAPALDKYGVLLMQDHRTVVYGEIPVVETRTILAHESGEIIVGNWFGAPAKDASIQGAGGAASYGRRFSWVALLGMVAEADDDGNGGDGNDASITRRPVAAPSSSAPKPSVGAAIQQQVEGFDREANKRAIFAALDKHGISATALRRQVIVDAEQAIGKPLAQFTPAQCMKFLQKAEAGDFNYVLSPDQEPAEDTGGLPV